MYHKLLPLQLLFDGWYKKDLVTQCIFPSEAELSNNLIAYNSYLTLSYLQKLCLTVGYSNARLYKVR